MQRNGGSSRYDMDAFPPPSADGGRSASQSSIRVWCIMSHPKQAFVLLPSGNHGEYARGKDEADFVYEGIICPALNKAFDGNIEILREIDNRSPGAITREIVRHIAEADICIVDITGQNPNVFFELGIRYSLRKSTTILLKQHATEIPFDVANFRCVIYDPLFHGAARAAEDLCETIKAVIRRPSNVTDSLVFEVYPDLVVTIPGVIDERVSPSEPRQMEWNEYLSKVTEIASELRDVFQNGQYVPDAVLGISNGGLIFADLLGRLVFGGVPILSLWAERGKKEFFENTINKAIVDGIRNRVEKPEDTRSILLVDDIVASGNTLQQAIGFLQMSFPQAQILFLPLFSRNAAAFDTMRERMLWSSRWFNLTSTAMAEKHSTDKYYLPYRKELRAA